MDYTDNQRDAIQNPARRLCVDAGAGSGKTRVLVERVAHLVEAQVPLEQIAAITFTEKAAAEMKSRLRETFRARADAAMDSPEEMLTWRSLEQRVDTARISTIHAFCAGFLREFSLHIGLDPDFRVLGDAEGALRLSDTVRGAVIELLEGQDEAAVTLAAEHGPGRLREMLETMTRHAPAVRQAETRFDFSSAAALYASWDELLEAERSAKLQAAAHGRAARGFISQLQRFAGSCAKPSDGREVLRQAMIISLQALGASTKEKEIVRHLEALTEKPARNLRANWASDEDYEALKKLQDNIKKFAEAALDWPTLDPALDLKAAAGACALHAVYRHALAAWEAAKRAVNGMDFDGLIQETLRVLQENPAVRARAAAGLRHLLMDEFQDTDRVQLQIAAALCGEEGGPAFFFVGDPKQSIYNFRGAEVELFAEEREKVLKTIPLRENFRTLAPLIQFINAFFGVSNLLHAVGAYAAMDVGRVHAGEDPMDTQRVELLVVAERDDDGVKRDAEAARREEARMIAARIRALCAADAPGVVYDDATQAWRKAEYKDIALLFRSTSSLYLYEEALRAAGIDFIATAGTGFHRRQEVLDVVNLLRVVVGPRDAAALAAYLRGPLGGLSDDAMVLLATAGGGLLAVFSREEVPAEFAAEDAAALGRARALVAALRERRHWAVPELLAYLYAESGIEAVVLDHHYGLQKAANLRKLMALAQELSSPARMPLERFVRYVSEVAEHEALREGEAMMQPFGGGAVTLMTVHKSKGLEFPVVFVCDMGQAQVDSRESALFLHRDLGWVLGATAEDGSSVKPALAKAIVARKAAKDEAESGRLLYVAMTRARDYLVLCGKEKPGKGSWFEALAHTYGVTGIPHHGEVKGEGWRARAWWHAAGEAARTRAEGGVEAGAIEATLARVGAPLAVTPGPVAISVSALLDQLGAAALEEEMDAMDDMDEEAARPRTQGGWALRRGSVVHRMMELWDFAGAPPIEATLEDAGLALDECETMRAELAAIAARVAAMPSFGALAGAARVEKELVFAWRVGTAVVHGTIDALAEGRVLVDYKTGRVDAAKAERYALQLRLYAVALAAITGAAPAEAVLVYVDEGREERVGLEAAALAEVAERVRVVLGG